MKRILSGLVLAVGLGAAPVLAGPADTTNALNACASGLPDHSRIAAGFIAAGFTDMGLIQHEGLDLNLFRSADSKTYVATRGATETGLRCFIVEDRLSVRRAEGMAGGLANLMSGTTELPAPKGGALEITKHVAGMYRDRMTLLAVVRGYEIGGIKGAGLMVMVQ